MQGTGIGLISNLAHNFLLHGDHYLPVVYLLLKLIEVRTKRPGSNSNVLV
jgi:hypothetical protein